MYAPPSAASGTKVAMVGNNARNPTATLVSSVLRTREPKIGRI